MVEENDIVYAKLGESLVKGEGDVVKGRVKNLRNGKFSLKVTDTLDCDHINKGRVVGRYELDSTVWSKDLEELIY